MTVRRIVSMQQNRAVAHVTADALVAEVLQSAAFADTGALAVSSDGRVVEGIISERDIVRGLGRMGPDLLSNPVRELMTTEVITCAIDDCAAEIMAVMVSRHVRHLPVVTDGKLVGMVSIHDLLKLRLEEARSEAEAWQKYIQWEMSMHARPKFVSG